MNINEKCAGYRVMFAETDFSGDNCTRYTGVGNVANAVHCDCPNCGKTMFPAMNFGFPDEDLAAVVDWDCASLRIFFCPFCALYMAPYWIRHRGERMEIVGGYRDGGEILQNIETPYLCREILLTPLTEDDCPVDEERLERLLAREREPGVYHQIGGVPIKAGDENLECCDCSAAMKFAGILDYDDLNVPLYEDEHFPVALIIGDYNSINIFLCRSCGIAGMKWVK